MKNFCNEQYKDLLARYGELEIQRKRIEKAQEDLQAQISYLDSLSPLLQKKQKEEKREGGKDE